MNVLLKIKGSSLSLWALEIAENEWVEIELLIFFFFGGNFRLTDGYTCHFEYLTVDLMVYMTINSRLMVCVRVCVFFWENKVD